ncbi:DMT family transporter [Alphaproteobacteria bacterium]|nr:DMT family transporter [Alphaproteobacteria bacterium]
MSPFHFSLVLLINLAWGFNFLAAKTAMDYFPPFMVLLFRFFLLFIILIPFLKIPKEKIVSVSLLSFISGVIYFSLNFVGLKLAGELTSPAIATQLFIPVGAVLAFIFLKEKLNYNTILAIFIAFLGVLVLSFDKTVFDNLFSLLFISLSAIPMAVATILMRKLRGVNTFQLQAWTGLIAIFPYLLLTLIFEDNHWNLLLSAPIEPILSIIYSVIAASLIGHGLLYFLLTHYQVGIVNPMLLMSPVFASIFGVIFRGDSLSFLLIIGGAMTLFGVTIIALRSKN